jgi:zinc transporter ZupT
VGYLGRRNEQAEDFLMSLTAGGFLYIATVTIIPSILQSAAHTQVSVALCQIGLEAAAFCAGVGFMIAVAFFE